MKRTNRVIVKLKCRKQKNFVMYKRKNLGNKSQELSNQKFSGRPFVSESMSHENQHANNSKVPGRFTLPGSLKIL